MLGLSSSPPNNSMARSCMFCGDHADSNEDAWPLWLLRELGQGRKARIGFERADGAIKTWGGVEAGVKVKHVCAGCNSGWMSDLEGMTKPIVTPYFYGNASNLTPDDQGIVAAWAVKTAMVFEAVRIPGLDWFYSADDRRHVRESRQPPGRASIWLAQYIGKLGSFGHAVDLGGQIEGSAHRIRSHVTTFAFGRLVIQVASIRLPEEHSGGIPINVDQKPGPWDVATVRVWPVVLSGVSWPPGVSLEDGGEGALDTFADRWGLIE